MEHSEVAVAAVGQIEVAAAVGPQPVELDENAQDVLAQVVCPEYIHAASTAVEQ